MKTILPIALALACIVLVVALIVTKHGGDAQHETDSNTIGDLSNQLTSAQSQISSRDAAILSISNNLAGSQSQSSTLSNQLTDAQSTISLNTEKINDLNGQLAQAKSENAALSQHVAKLTNQVSGLAAQLAQTSANLIQTNKDLVQANKQYQLLENRFRVDVAERVVTQRKFNNLSAVKAQLQYLRAMPPVDVTAESIYAGLNVEVKSNGTFHVLEPN